MLSNVTVIKMVSIVAVITLFTRCAPFLFFSGKRKLPKMIEYLGKMLPPAIISALVVYCVKDAGFTSAPYGAPYLISVAVTALLHICFNQYLVSILGGTIVFMIFSRIVFL